MHVARTYLLSDSVLDPSGSTRSLPHILYCQLLSRYRAVCPYLAILVVPFLHLGLRQTCNPVSPSHTLHVLASTSSTIVVLPALQSARLAPLYNNQRIVHRFRISSANVKQFLLVPYNIYYSKIWSNGVARPRGAACRVSC